MVKHSAPNLCEQISQCVGSLQAAETWVYDDDDDDDGGDEEFEPNILTTSKIPLCQWMTTTMLAFTRAQL